MPRYFRKIIKIRAEDSPNVQLGMAQASKGVEHDPINDRLLPGVITYFDYLKKRKVWDKVRQCVGLDAEFYEGGELLFFPPEWLNLAEAYQSVRPPPQKEKWMGIDVAEGGDETAWCIVDEYGILHEESHQTSDTTVIAGRTRELLKEWTLPITHALMDRGGGGKQIADYMRLAGWNIQTVAFSEGVSHDIDERTDRKAEKDMDEQQAEYANRRAQMYGEASKIFDPARLKIATSINMDGDTNIMPEFHSFAFPPQYAELRRQLAPTPKEYDTEGRLKLPPKNKPSAGYTGKTIRELIGCSPDKADAFVIATHMMLRKKPMSSWFVVPKVEKKPDAKKDVFIPMRRIR